MTGYLPIILIALLLEVKSLRARVAALEGSA